MVDTNPSKSAPLGGAHRTLTQHQMLHRIKADRAAFESTLYPGFNIRDLEDLQQSQNLNELTFALFTGVVAWIRQ